MSLALDLEQKQTVYVCFCVQEMGGYFIVNGIERVVRMLVMQRRNFVITNFLSYMTAY